MGRQVNFYMHPDDLAEFEAMLNARGQICFLERRSSTPATVTRQGLAADQPKEPPLAYLVQEHHLSNVRTIVIGEEFYVVDVHQSPVVELMPSVYDGDVLGRGRLYFLPGHYDGNDQYVNKPGDFLKWADSLLRWIRRHYRRHPETGWYVGPHADRWVSHDGGQLSLL
jgi:hypothetical protein